MSRIDPKTRFVGTAEAVAAEVNSPAPRADKAAIPAVAPAAPAPFVPMPPWQAAIYAASSLTLGLTQGLGLNLVTSNIVGLQGALHATAVEMAWLPAAYFATNITGTIVLFKVRNQFGLRRFAEIGIIVYLTLTLAHLFTNDLRSALLVRAVMGFAAAPLSTLAFFYMLEWLPPAKKLTVGICFGMAGSNLALPISRIISPDLLQIGDWHGLYLLEAGFAALSFAIVFLVPITHPPRIKSFDMDDWLSLPLLTTTFACFSIVLSLGKTYWWLEAPWLGVLLAVGVGSAALLLLVEFHRENPIIDLRWLTSREMVTFAGALLIFRLLLSEQSVGAINLFTALGMQNDQLVPLFWVIGIATFLSTVVLSQIIKPERVVPIHLVALAMIAMAAWLDSQSTVLSRPEQFYVSQALMGSASALFLPPAMLSGFSKALARGPRYILSFLIVFLSTQTVGGMLGSAALSSFATLREQFHSNVIAQDITMLDPNVAARVATYGGVYARALTDPALRNAEGLALLGQAATQQANVLAYNDLFMTILVLTLATMAVLLIMTVVQFLNKPVAAGEAQPT
ncbi:MAG: transporter [Massilia sp.]|nr:transporter [Massilia sp.]